MPTERQKLVAHHVIGLGKSISATAKQIGASPTSVRGSLISYCIKMMPSLEHELTAWVEHKDRGRHRLAVIRAHKDQLMPAADQKPRVTHEQQLSVGEIDVSDKPAAQVKPPASTCDGGRNPIYEGQFDGETTEQAVHRLYWATAGLAMGRDVAADRHARDSAELRRLCGERDQLRKELAALKAQPSGVVSELRTVVTDALMGMIAAVTSSTPPANEPPPPFIQSAIDRAVDRIARLNQPDIAGEPVYQFQCREIGEGDWEPCDHRGYLYCQKSPEVDTRVVQVQALSAPSHGEQVRWMVPEGYSLVPTVKLKQFLADAMTAAGLVSSGKKSCEIGSRIGAYCMEFYPLLAAAPSAGSQKERGE